MANRFIKSTIWTSPNLNSLPEEAELLFYRLLPLPDDHGCFDADPRVLKGLLFPIRSSISIDNICERLLSLVGNGIISIWSESGRVYGVFNNWGKHQQIRSKYRRKTPEPPTNTSELNDDETIKLLKDIVISCYQAISIDAPLPYSLFPSPSSLLPPNLNSPATPENFKEQEEQWRKDGIKLGQIALTRRYKGGGEDAMRLTAMIWNQYKPYNITPKMFEWIINAKIIPNCNDVQHCLAYSRKIGDVKGEHVSEARRCIAIED